VLELRAGLRRVPGARATVRRVLGRSARGDGACRVCGAGGLVARDLVYARDSERTCSIRRCRECGYIAILRSEESLWKDRADLDHGHGSGRVGDHEQPGREFHMAKMAADILRRPDLRALVYGAGGSLDNLHIQRLDGVERAAVGDIMRLRDDADFVDLNQPASERFDLVVAGEVIEHFRDPRADFDRLFGFVRRKGLVVASTNIHAGNPLARDGYIFYPDHTSYYSPRSLRMIANDAGFHVDFRAPLIGPRMRKRYVFFSRSRSVLEDVACYFGTEVYAPSEEAHPKRPPPQRTHADWREEREVPTALDGQSPKAEQAAEHG
jgi:SAM-dependent methyltransferase